MKTITLFGDSILFGIVVNPDNMRYTRDRNFDLRALGSSLGFELLNVSRMGRNSGEGIATVKEYLENHEVPDFSVIEFGGNDCDFDWKKIAVCPDKTIKPKVPYGEFLENMAVMADILKKAGSKVAFMSLPPLAPNEYFNWVTTDESSKNNVLSFLGDRAQIYRYQELYNNGVVELSHKLGLPLIDVRERFLTSRDFLSLMSVDGVHPSPEGQKLIKSALSDFMINSKCE